jgi:hypothetical protein
VARPTKLHGRNKGRPRYRVVYRLHGAGSAHHYGGSFATKSEALERKRWIDGELAGRRIPDVRQSLEQHLAPTVRAACDAWRASRVDVTELTQVLHRVALARVLPVLGSMSVDEVGETDVQRLVTELAGKGKKRETIRKSVKYLAAVLDEHGRVPNPARSRKIRLPHEEEEELSPPLAAHVEAVYGLLARPYRLPLLWLDWSGARVASVDLLTVSDYDERAHRIRLRASTTKTRAALWVDLHPELADASRRPCRHARTATPRRRCSPTRPPTGYAPRLAEHANSPASRCSRRTTSGTDVSACCTLRAGRGRRSPGSSARRSCRSRQTRTRT